MPAERDQRAPLLERYPVLLGLERLRRCRRRVPYVQQTSSVDCGAACLTALLHYHGRHVALEEVRRWTGAGRDGASAHDLMQAARTFGLRGRGVRCEKDDVPYLETPAILHWNFRHYVVLERRRRGGYDIVDPGFGPRFVSEEEFGRSFTGVALLLEPSEEFTESRSNSDLVWRYFRRILGHSTVLVRILLSSGLIQLFALALPLLTAALVDRVIPRNDHELLGVLLAGVLGMTAFRTLTNVMRSQLLLHFRTNLDVQLTFDFVDHMIDLPFAFFQDRSAGDLIQRMGSNATVREILTSSALSTVLDGVLVTSYLGLLVLVHPVMGLLVLGLGLAQVLPLVILRRRYRELMSQGLQAQAELSGYQVQMLGGIETLKAGGVEHRAMERWANLFVDVLNVSLHRGRLGIRVEAIGGFLSVGSPLILLGYGGHLVMTGQLSLGTMLALSALAAGFLGPLSNLVTTGFRLSELGSYLDRIKDVLDQPAEQPVGEGTRVERLDGAISLEHVTFRYAPNAPLVVNDVSLEIGAGQSVALVGESGSGKSTLAKLLLGLYRPTSGRVLYDGRDLADLDCRSVRARVGYVPQQPYLFGTTIRGNIGLANSETSLEEIVRAAETACIHDTVVAMPMAYETPIADGGTSLSVGQRQRIALARALVGKPSILLLDEATSALDAVTEGAVVDNLAALRSTRIVIAHRLSTIMRADLILVVQDGAIVERGTHQELLLRNGVYRNLVAAQLEGQEIAS